MTEFGGCSCEHERARAHAYTYVCARGLPAYFGILIARGRPSPLPFSLPTSVARSSPHLAPPRVLPRPCTPAPPSGAPRRTESSCFLSPLETSPIPKNLGSTRQPPVTRILTCVDVPRRHIRATRRTSVYVSYAESRRSPSLSRLDFFGENRRLNFSPDLNSRKCIHRRVSGNVKVSRQKNSTPLSETASRISSAKTLFAKENVSVMFGTHERSFELFPIPLTLTSLALAVPSHPRIHRGLESRE